MIKFYYTVDRHGYYKSGSFIPYPQKGNSDTLKAVEVKTTRQLVRVMIGENTSDALFNAAWKKATSQGIIINSHPLKKDDASDMTKDIALIDATTVDSIISEMVNNPKSKYYIYG